MGQSCYHCKESFTFKAIEFDGKDFCCLGCKGVYELLSEHSMQSFYNLKTKNKVSYTNDSFNYLDHEDFFKQFVKTDEKNINTFSFYIEGIHCAACLWLLERLGEINKGILESYLNMDSSILEVRYHRDHKLSDIAYLIERFGYKPHPILTSQDKKALEYKENRNDIFRIGLSFACAGNIMLYSFAVYLGAPATFAKYFNIFSFFCSIPIIFYCSLPFYKNAFTALKLKRVSIDVPIVFAVLLTFIMGIISFFTKYEFYYFDTIATLIFLLLCSRYLLKIIQKRATKLAKIQNTYMYGPVTRIENGREVEVLAKYVNVGDTLIVKPNETIPVDARVISGKSYVNNAVVTGESSPVEVRAKSKVYMGAQNISETLTIYTEKTSENSTMGKIIRELERNWNTLDIKSRLDRISQFFVTIVILSSCISFFYFLFFDSFSVALNRSFSLILITCPCALAISTPLAFILGLSSFFKHGVFVKDEKVFERILDIRNIFFDKTGTLTDGDFQLDLNEIPKEYIDILYAIESFSNHIIGKSITKQLSTLGLKKLEVKEFNEIIGSGVEAKILNNKYRIVKSQQEEGVFNKVDFFENDELKFTFQVDDNLKRNTIFDIQKLKRKKLNLFIVSGDSKNRVYNIASKLGIVLENCYYSVLPFEKKKIIEHKSYGMMVGDGVNDVVAMKAASVSVAVSGATSASLRASDIYIEENSKVLISDIFTGTDKIYNIIKRNLIISIIYNIIGAFCALSGLVTPIFAAIFMPISSVTVILSTVIAIKSMNKVFNHD
ncbi:MAG: heavy metal translocating P-type ATPase [Bacteriovoracaceae bacterium]|jgi:Cu2+-exporting ATPase/Cu+-exporting ATPase|nr:heavy metal translocating P-type ATPase [Bacteriovoracaceae bacterium]